MTRPTILDLDLVVVPREATLPIVSAYSEKQDEYGISHFANARVVYPAMLSASPYPTTWDDVRKYVEGLEEELKWLRDNSVLMPIFNSAANRAEAAEARIAELEAKIDEAFINGMAHGQAAMPSGTFVTIDSEEMVIMRGRIAELEKRLADAERVIDDFMDITEPASIPAFKDPQYADEVERLGERIGFGALIASASASWREVAKRNGQHAGGEFVVGPCMAVLQSVRRAARAYMEGK